MSLLGTIGQPISEFDGPMDSVRVPAWLLGWGGGSLQACVAAFAIQFAGLLAERWYFFAEARHPQNLYYQSMA